MSAIEVEILTLPELLQNILLQMVKKCDGNFGYIKSFLSFASDYDRNNRNE